MIQIVRTPKKMLYYLILSLIVSACVGTRHEQFEAGFATIDITPSEGTIYDTLYAKAIVLSQGGEIGAFVICDVIGIKSELVDKARSLSMEMTGIPAEHISISATHTHAGGICKDLSVRIANAINEAYNKLQPIEIWSGTVKQEGLAFNRRFLMIDGTIRMNPGIDPITNTSTENGWPFLNPEIIRSVGPVDIDLPIVLFKDADGKPVGSLTCFAMHTTATAQRFSADFPGVLARELASNYGEDFISIYGIGTSGDVNNWNVNEPGETQDGPVRSREIGMELASSFLNGLSSLSKHTENLKILNTVVNIPINPVSEMDVEWARSATMDGFKDFIYENRRFLATVRARKILRLAEMHENNVESLPLEVMAYRINDQTAIVALPGEIFVELGLTIKEHSPFSNTLIIELSNDDCGYVPTLKAYSETGYEVVSSTVAPGGGEMLAEAAIKMLNQLGY